MAKSQKETRSRSWVFVVYPESAPKDWRAILDKQGITWVESPLHNKDVNPDGEVKKEHWHVLLMFQTLKSYGQMQEISHELRSPNPQKCMTIRGMVRYFAHIDNPEKYQYPVN
ncbi:replication protein, partial [Enterococcus faecium]|uniref:replication protein n=1 Tax=Enterococcus faecium TaxID=1352 RepID=UPI0034E9509B